MSEFIGWNIRSVRLMETLRTLHEKAIWHADEADRAERDSKNSPWSEDYLRGAAEAYQQAFEIVRMKV